MAKEWKEKTVNLFEGIEWYKNIDGRDRHILVENNPTWRFLVGNVYGSDITYRIYEQDITKKEAIAYAKAYMENN